MLSSALIIKHYVALIAITNPLSALAIFLGLTESYTAKESNSTALLTFIGICVILIIMTWVGLPLLSVFGISPAEFSIAGGAVIIYIGFEMLQGNMSKSSHSSEEHQAAQKKNSIAIIPLAIPMIAGPGAMVQTVLIANTMPTITGKITLSIISCVVALTIYLVLRFSGPVHRLLGVSGLKIVTRVMGLILMSMAVSMMAKGFVGIFPGWQ